MSCPFCEIIAGDDPNGAIITESSEHVVLRPLNPVTPGHHLVIPTRHWTHQNIPVPLMGRVFAGAYAWASADAHTADFNIITSCGPSATQTVEHVHIHVVPRRPGDGLRLPWTGQQHRSGPPDGTRWNWNPFENAFVDRDGTRWEPPR